MTEFPIGSRVKVSAEGLALFTTERKKDRARQLRGTIVGWSWKHDDPIVRWDGRQAREPWDASYLAPAPEARRGP